MKITTVFWPSKRLPNVTACPFSSRISSLETVAIFSLVEISLGDTLMSDVSSSSCLWNLNLAVALRPRVGNPHDRPSLQVRTVWTDLDHPGYRSTGPPLWFVASESVERVLRSLNSLDGVYLVELFAGAPHHTAGVTDVFE